MNLIPKGFLLDEEHWSLLEPVVTVSSDLPVHRTLHTNRLGEGGSPFLLLSREMDTSAFFEWQARLSAILEVQQNRVSYSVADFARGGNWNTARQYLQTILEEHGPSDDLSTICLCHRVIGTFFLSLCSVSECKEFRDNYFLFLNDCLLNKKAAYTALLEEWSNDQLYRSLRVKALSIFLEVLSNLDTYVVGLLYDSAPREFKRRIDDFRVFRDDYYIARCLYQDLFDVTSQLLIYLGSIVNLSVRSSPWQYVTGYSSVEAFKSVSALERFEIISELPLKLSSLIGGVGLRIRDRTGRFNADYLPGTGRIQYDDGTEENYVAFLGELFASVKSLAVTLCFIEKADIDMTRFGIRIPVTYR